MERCRGWKERGNKIYHAMKRSHVLYGELHMCLLEQKKCINIQYRQSHGGQDAKYRYDLVRVGDCSMTWAKMFISFPCSWCVHGMKPNISVCDYVCCLQKQWQTNTHTLRVSGPHFREMMLSGQSPQTDVSALLKKMPVSPWGWEKAMNKFITLMYWP